MRSRSIGTSRVLPVTQPNDRLAHLVQQRHPRLQPLWAGIRSSSPALATLANGKYLVSWVQSDGAGAAPSVRARVYDVDQGPIGTEVKADTGTATERRNLSAGAVFEGGEGDTTFLVWADEGGAAGDTSGLAVRGRTFTVTSQGQLL